MSVATDSQGLYNASAFPDAIHWSEDNLLAVGSGGAIVIMSPSDLSGPRMFAEIEPNLRGEPSMWRYGAPKDHLKQMCSGCSPQQELFMARTEKIPMLAERLINVAVQAHAT